MAVPDQHSDSCFELLHGLHNIEDVKFFSDLLLASVEYHFSFSLVLLASAQPHNFANHDVLEFFHQRELDW